MSGFEATNGHSAEVRLHLILDGKRLRPTQIGPEFFMLQEPATCLRARRN